MNWQGIGQKVSGFLEKQSAGTPADEITEAFIVIEVRREVAFNPNTKLMRSVGDKALIRLEWAGRRKNVELELDEAQALVAAIGE